MHQRCSVLLEKGQCEYQVFAFAQHYHTQGAVIYADPTNPPRWVLPPPSEPRANYAIPHEGPNSALAGPGIEPQSSVCPCNELMPGSGSATLAVHRGSFVTLLDKRMGDH